MITPPKNQDTISFFARLAIYALATLATGGYIYGFILYMFLDQVVMDLFLIKVIGL